MKKQITLIMLTLFSVINALAAEEVPDSIFDSVTEAVYAMDDGDYDKSISILEAVIKKYPKYYNAVYELGLAHCYKKEYKKTISILKKLEKHPDTNDLLFQLLGSAYDMNGQPDKAIKTYSRGLKKFPLSGKLYMESGTVYYIQRKYDMALSYYEKGIEIDPLFPSNYFRAADLFCNSNEKVFGLMYGEIMINMQPESPRAKIMSKMLFDTYKNAVIFPNDSTINVSFTKRNQLGFNDKTGVLEIPFEIIYEMNMSKSITPSLGGSREVNLRNLNSLRNGFIENYYASAGDNSNLLFEYHKKVIEAGHFEAYNMWLLREGAPGEFDIWAADNEAKFIEFWKWYKENPLKVTLENRFSRKTANMVFNPENKKH